MKLYVANVTKQNHIFAYYILGNPKLQEPQIQSGEQILIEGEKDGLEKIIASHRRYGVVEACEAKRAKGFSGVAFQFDKPINIGTLRDAAEKRGEFEDERANDMRHDSVAAVHNAVSKGAREVGIDEVRTSVEFEEKQAPGSANRGAPLRQKLEIVDKPTQRRRA